MCIAILRKPTGTITDEAIQNSARANSDGGGYAYWDPEAKKVVVKKGFSTVSKFLEAFRADEQKYGNHPMLLHFRIATMGKVCEDNCHPFLFEHGAAIHNGTFFNGGYLAEKSDTRLFIEDAGKYIIPAKLADPEKVRKLGEVIGSYNKMAFLFNDGSYAIINESGGYWDNDVWYSNSSYRCSFYSRGGRHYSSDFSRCGYPRSWTYDEDGGAEAYVRGRVMD